MKKLIVLFVSALTFFSCGKESLDPEASRNIENIIKNDIEVISEKYLKDRQYLILSSKPKTNWWKTTVVSAADVAGAIAGGSAGALTGPGAVIATPYFAAWVGFMASAGMQELYPPMLTYNPSPVDKFNFHSNIYGVAHNELLYYSLTNKIDLQLDSGAISVDLEQLLLSKKYFEGDINIVFEKFKDVKGVLLNDISNTYYNFKENKLEYEFYKKYSSSEQEVIFYLETKKVIEQLGNIEEASKFLLELDSYLLQTKNFTNTEKEKLHMFLAVYNASLHFWEINS